MTSLIKASCSCACLQWEQYFEGDQIEEAKQWLHDQFVEQEEKHTPDPADFVLERCIAGGGTSGEIYTYDPVDFMSRAVQESVEYVEVLINEDFVDESNRLNLLKFLEEEQLMIVPIPRKELPHKKAKTAN